MICKLFPTGEQPDFYAQTLLSVKYQLLNGINLLLRACLLFSLSDTEIVIYSWAESSGSLICLGTQCTNKQVNISQTERTFCNSLRLSPADVKFLSQTSKSDLGTNQINRFPLWLIFNLLTVCLTAITNIILSLHTIAGCPCKGNREW